MTTCLDDASREQQQQQKPAIQASVNYGTKYHKDILSTYIDSFIAGMDFFSRDN